MPTPAQAHFMRATAAAETSAAAEENPLALATGHELMLHKLANDRRRLKETQSTELKAEIKRELLSEYVPYVEGVLAAGTGVQDEVLMTVLIWRIDAGDGQGAIEIARYAIAHQLSLPDQFKRTTATLIAEEFADLAKRARDGGEPVDVTSLNTVLEITTGQDMPDEVRAKLHKEIGLAQRLSIGEPPFSDEQLALGHTALEHMKRAMQLHDKVGIKKEMEKLERELKNSTTSSAGS
ncbi:terminase endonuclease subunit [Pseudomonas sp. NPDC087804]|uniref:phage terminase small subunit n=1 Tax=Pseudomonas sp. NPDC087804 TaxID=3364449 RepID=UPI003823F34E